MSNRIRSFVGLCTLHVILLDQVQGRSSGGTVCLGSTKGLTLFQPFYPRNVPKRVIGLSSGIKMLFFIPLHTIFVFFQDFLIEIAEIKCNHSLFC